MRCLRRLALLPFTELLSSATLPLSSSCSLVACLSTLQIRYAALLGVCVYCCAVSPVCFRIAVAAARALCVFRMRAQLGRTPAMLAVENGHTGVFDVLLQHGASLTVMSADGRSPIDYAPSPIGMEMAQSLPA